VFSLHSYLLQSFKLRSTTIKKNLNPEWNETLVYYGIREEDLSRKSLQLCVLDEDPIGYDFLGETRVQLKTLRDRQQKDCSVFLEHLMPVSGRFVFSPKYFYKVRRKCRFVNGCMCTKVTRNAGGRNRGPGRQGPHPSLAVV
jgi:Ca2+-dependent lipid-binding protein